MSKIKAFFKGVEKERKMVRWPSGKDMVKYSVMVLTLMVFFIFLSTRCIIYFLERISGLIWIIKNYGM